MEGKHANRFILFLSLVIAILAISSSAILVKEAKAPSSIIATYRLMFTILILFFPTLIYHRRELFAVQKRELVYSIFSGLFLALHFITWFESLNYTSIASSVVLVTMQPIFAMMGGVIFFKEKYHILSILGSLLAVIGGMIIGWGDFRIGGMALWGDILALLGALLATVYWLLGQSVRRRMSLLPYAMLVYGSSTILLILYDLIFSYPLFAYSKRNWIFFILIAIIPNILGHTIFNWSMRYISATTVSMLILGEPIGSTILAYIIYKEHLNLTQWVGSFFIFLGIYIYIRYQTNTKLENESFS
ncbi:DMT family transporter [Tepidibacillus marianensis]|uniref:DMT family transporter n=1 Tax=Tepidibacillus marianensis TaxID=3131995 RepID=UPI0030D2D472